MAGVLDELDKLGGYSSNMRSDSKEFREIKRYVASLPPPPEKATTTEDDTAADVSKGDGAPTDRPASPSSRFQRFENDLLRLNHPDNWLVFEDETSITLTPEGGTVRQQSGGSALAYGMLISVSEVPQDGGRELTLEDVTDQLLERLRRSNPDMRIQQGYRRTRLADTSALTTILSNASPVGGQETDWLITLLRPEGLIYIVSVAPDDQYENYRESFEDIVSSIRFR